jgi:hypothetical protein
MRPSIQQQAALWQSQEEEDEPTRILARVPASLAAVSIPAEAASGAIEIPPEYSRARKLVFGIVGALFGVLLSVLLTPKLVVAMHTYGTSWLAEAVALVRPAPRPTPRPSHAAAGSAMQARAARDERADAKLDRMQFKFMSGGVLAIPASFASPNGAYDLVIHFHGLNDIVEDSFGEAGLNAVVVIINLGIGSAAYESQFGNGTALPTILKKTQAALQARGLRGAKLRRLALSGFSAGYGAVRGILSQPKLAEQVNAVLLLDGIHAGYLPRDHTLDVDRLAPFVRFAQQATAGKRLFSITHSEITNGYYAGTHESTDALLASVGVEREWGGDVSRCTALPSPGNPQKADPFVQQSEARRGSLHVRGYGGTAKEDHMMHLRHMSETAVPDLVRYWSAGSAP